jgi:hypothetical protein
MKFETFLEYSNGQMETIVSQFKGTISPSVKYSTVIEQIVQYEDKYYSDIRKKRFSHGWTWVEFEDSDNIEVEVHANISGNPIIDSISNLYFYDDNNPYCDGVQTLYFSTEEPMFEYKDLIFRFSTEEAISVSKKVRYSDYYISKNITEEGLKLIKEKELYTK